MTGEKPNETLVVAGKPMHPERDARDEQARKDRQRCDNDEGDKDAADVCPERVARAGQRQSSPAALRVENGEPQRRSTLVVRGFAGSGIVLGCDGFGR